MTRILLALLGAAAGGAVGWWAYGWVMEQGFYSSALPGGLLGLGAGVVATRARWLPFACAAAALALGCLAEWHYFPFKDDESLTFFVKNVHHLKPITLIMIAFGGLVGFYVPFRRLSDAPRKPG